MWYHFLLIHLFENDTIISIKNIPPVPFDLAHFYGVQSFFWNILCQKILLYPKIWLGSLVGMLMVNLINHITDSKTTPFSINLFFINFSDFLLENLDCWENQVTFCFCMRFKHMALTFMKGKIFYYVIIMYIGVSLFFTKPPLKSANSPSLWSKSTFWVNP